MSLCGTVICFESVRSNAQCLNMFEFKYRSHIKFKYRELCVSTICYESFRLNTQHSNIFEFKYCPHSKCKHRFVFVLIVFVCVCMYVRTIANVCHSVFA